MHSIHEDSTDILHIDLVGKLVGIELAAIMKIQNEWARGKERYFVLVNIKRLETVTTDARPVLREHVWPEIRPMMVVAYGGSFAVRTLGEMVVRARRLLHSVDPSPTTFVSTETEARKMIDSLRNAVH